MNTPRGELTPQLEWRNFGRFLETRGAGEAGFGLIVFIEFLTPLDTAKRLKSLLSEASEGWTTALNEGASEAEDTTVRHAPDHHQSRSTVGMGRRWGMPVQKMMAPEPEV